MEKNRCAWCLGSEMYKRYHDEEWGVPVYDDQKQFEFLVLESAQAGLSWSTVLHKRENYRIAYEGFDVRKVADFDDEKIEEMLGNAGLIRNRAKITSSIGNAKLFLAIQKEFGSFSNYLWGFIGSKPLINHWQSLHEIPAKTPLSDTIAKDMKKRGFKFLGSTVVYAHLQATGLIMDHVTTCWRYNELS